MFKRIYKLIYIIIAILIITLIYLSFIGIKTSVFNNVLENKIKEIDQRLSISLKQVYLKLNLKNIQVKIQTENPEIFFDRVPIYLEEISLNFEPLKLLNEKNNVNSVFLQSKENSIENIFTIINRYRLNFPLLLFQKRIENGFISFNTEIFFDNENGDILDFKSKGKVSNINLKLLDENKIQNLDFNFEIFNDVLHLKKIKLLFNKIIFTSKKIAITKNTNSFNIDGEFSNINQEINTSFIKKFIGLKQVNNISKNLNIQSKNTFYISISKKLKIIDYKFNSLLKIKSLNLNLNTKLLKRFFPDFSEKINFKELDLKITSLKNNLNILGKSKYKIKGKEYDSLNFSYNKKDNKEIISSEINLNNLLFRIGKLNFTKNINEDSKIEFESEIKDNEIIINNLYFINNNNNITIDKLILNNNDYKIKNIKEVKIKLINDKQINNELSLLGNKKEFIFIGESIDFSQFLDDILKDTQNNNLSYLFDDLDANIKVQISKVFLDKKNFLENVYGKIKVNKNKTKSAEITSDNLNTGKFKLTQKIIDDEMVTTIFADNAEPFVKKFKFIKGFQDGTLDFYSTKKDDTSKSSIRIYSFKLKNIPILTKILSLASLQGIADLMTGEGIRFDDFEMNFSNKNNVMTIDEIYAIGPAISILMSGYVEKNNLVSLRGTLVPATTINKTIGSIPILGDILIGNKTGEGVFGVSFKIKGPPKDLKTTVNPIKTLTPRFITRTLEKIKKN